MGSPGEQGHQDKKGTQREAGGKARGQGAWQTVLSLPRPLCGGRRREEVTWPLQEVGSLRARTLGGEGAFGPRVQLPQCSAQGHRDLLEAT